MENQADIREFLVTRRARLRPEDVGMTAGTNRRVAGLRRSEVAALADVSIEYYSRLERGNLSGVSEGVLDAIAGALRLDDAERAHLFDLARAANDSPIRVRTRPKRTGIRPAMQYALNGITGSAAVLRNGRLDILAANLLGFAMYSELFANEQRPANIARFQFLDRERSERFYPDWDSSADTCVAILRTEAGRDPHDKGLQDLIGELSTRSDAFRSRWAKHNVRDHSTGVKRFHHPIVGDLELIYEGMNPTADPGLNLLIYSAEPNSASADGLSLLASWAASDERISRLSAAIVT